MLAVPRMGDKTVAQLIAYHAVAGAKSRNLKISIRPEEVPRFPQGLTIEVCTWKCG